MLSKTLNVNSTSAPDRIVKMHPLEWYPKAGSTPGVCGLEPDHHADIEE